MLFRAKLLKTDIPRIAINISTNRHIATKTEPFQALWSHVDVAANYNHLSKTNHKRKAISQLCSDQSSKLYTNIHLNVQTE